MRHRGGGRHCTGYSRLLDQSRAEEYTNLDGDAAATVVAMSAWLTAHKRWNSPVYILGESYGTIRTALVAEALYGNERAVCGGVSLQLAGIINLGSALNHAQEDFPIPREVMNLPSIAAANWYHHPEGKGTLKEFVSAANEFAYGDYLRAIALGRRLPEEEQRKVAERLSELTALPVKKLMENKLRINTFVYRRRCLPKRERPSAFTTPAFRWASLKTLPPSTSAKTTPRPRWATPRSSALSAAFGGMR